MGAVSPLASNSDLVVFTVLAGGSKLPDTWQVQQVHVHKQVNRIASARLTLYDGSASAESFPISASTTLFPGADVEITAGYHNAAEKTLFKGVVVRHAIKVKADRKSYLVLTCYDKALKMTVGRKSGYVGKSDSALFEQLIGDSDLTAQVESTDDTADEIVRYYATDWDFMVARAEINGRIVLVDDGTVTVQAPKVDADPGLQIEYGAALDELSVEIDAAAQYASVGCSAWDYAAQAAASAASSEPAVTGIGNFAGTDLANVLAAGPIALQATAPSSPAELTQWANAQLLKSRLAMVRGKVSFRGNALPKPGGLIELKGVGPRFSGNAFVSSVQHHIENGNWSTEAGLGLSPQWFVEEAADIEAPLASGMLPGVNGLLIGKVKQIDQDPAGQNRILVEVPMINASGDGIWARQASGYASNGVGVLFVPELGDEVVLGFLNDDPRAAVILGSLNSSANPPTYPPDAPNTYKAIVTKGLLTVLLDDVKKIITVKTPGGHVLTMDDDQQQVTLVDSNQNRMKFSAAGIQLDSCADLVMSAKGKVSITAEGGDMTLSAAAGALNGSAESVSVTADTSLSLQGSASAKLASSGELAVQGSMVMIN
jgi:Rhs element Vgr protein